MQGTFNPDVAELIKPALAIYLLGIADENDIDAQLFINDEEEEQVTDETFFNILQQRNPVMYRAMNEEINRRKRMEGRERGNKLRLLLLLTPRLLKTFKRTTSGDTIEWLSDTFNSTVLRRWCYVRCKQAIELHKSETQRRSSRKGRRGCSRQSSSLLRLLSGRKQTRWCVNNSAALPGMLSRGYVIEGMTIGSGAYQEFKTPFESEPVYYDSASNSVGTGGRIASIRGEMPFRTSGVNPEPDHPAVQAASCSTYSRWTGNRIWYHCSSV